MPITFEDLDGEYEVRSATSQGGPFVVNGDGVTVVKNGMTFRKDKNGLIWESAFSVIDENKVKVESTVDPSHSTSDKFILDENGNPTKAIVTYKSVLDAAIVDGKLVLSGVIKHGKDMTRLTMKKI